MTDFKSQIQRILPPLLTEVGAFLVDVTVSRDRQRTIIEVFVDTDTGITIDQCAEISRHLGRELESVTEAQTPYRLEVSSPGIDRPLRHLRQYQKNVGRTFAVRHLGETGEASFRGTLKSVEGTDLTFETADARQLRIPFDHVVDSSEVLPW